MTWIDEIDESDAGGKLADLYARMKDPLGPGVANIMKCQSLDPAAMEGHAGIYAAIVRGTRELPRAEREMIAVTVSRLNDCHY